MLLTRKGHDGPVSHSHRSPGLSSSLSAALSRALPTMDRRAFL
jgi:hypothetical protein